MMDHETEDILKAQTLVYLELLDKGIRQVCMPNFGVWEKEELNFIDEMVEAWGFRTITLTQQRVGNDECGAEVLLEGIISYQKILYAEEGAEKASQLKLLLEKPFKSKSDHRKIGRLFGYSDRKITDFVDGKKYSFPQFSIP